MTKKNPPKIGEIRIGRAGNKYNKWTGSKWVPVSAARTAGAQGRKPSVVSKPVPSKTGNRRSTAGTVSSAIATGKAKGPGKKPSQSRTQVAIPLPYYQPKVDITGVRSAVEKGVSGFVSGGMREVSRNKNKKPKTRTQINIPLPVYSPTVDITGAKSTAENFFRGAFKGMRGK